MPGTGACGNGKPLSGSTTVNEVVLKPKPPPAHERIIEAARDLFCRNGIHATGIDAILASAGASKMTLYGRFGSKDALLREVLDREGEDWRRAFMQAVAAAGPDPVVQLGGVTAALGQWYQGGRFTGCAFMNAIAEHDKPTAWLRDVAAEHHAKVLGFLAGLAEAVGFQEPKIVARQILLLIDGATAALMVTGDAAVLDIARRNLDAILATAERQVAGEAAISRSIGFQV